MAFRRNVAKWARFVWSRAEAYRGVFRVGSLAELGFSSKTSTRMGLHRCYGLYCSDSTFRSDGSAGPSFRTGAENQGLQNVRSRPRVRRIRAARGLPVGNLPGTRRKRSREKPGSGVLSVSDLRGLEAGQGSADNRLPRSKQALGQGSNCNGNFARFLFRNTARRPLDFVRFERGIPCHKTAPEYGEIFHVHLWKAFLYLLYAAVWLEPLPYVVYESNVSGGETPSSRDRMSCTTLLGRFLAHRGQWTEARFRRRCACTELYSKRPTSYPGTGSAPNQGGLGGWYHTIGTSGGSSRHYDNSFLHHACETGGPELDGVKNAQTSPVWWFLSVYFTVAEILGKSYIKFGTSSVSSFLLSKFVRRLKQQCVKSGGQGTHKIGKDSPFAGQPPGPKNVGHPDCRGWSVALCGRGVLVPPYRRCGCWFRGYFGTGCDTRLPWTPRSPSTVVTVSTVTVDYDSGAGGGSESSGDEGFQSPAELHSPNTDQPTAAVDSHRQLGSGTNPVEYGERVPSSHARASPTASAPRENENSNSGQLVAERDQSARRPSVAHVERSRCHGQDFCLDLARHLTAAAESPPSLAAAGSTRSAVENNQSAISRILGRRPFTAVEPAPVLDTRDSTQDLARERPGRDHSAALAQAALVRSLDSGLHGDGSGPSSGANYVGPVHVRKKPALGSGRGGHRGTALAGIVAGIEAAAPNTRGGAASIRLATHALAASTDKTQSSAWNKFARFCSSEGHAPLPASVACLLAYIGFLFDEDRVHASSLDGYLSAIRTRHSRAHFPDPFSDPTIQSLLLAFRRADDARGSFIDSRAALSSDIMLSVHNLGLECTTGSMMERDTVICELQYLLTWREGSVLTLLQGDVSVVREDDRISITVRPRSLKGRPVRNAVATTLICFDDHTGANGLALQLRYFTISTISLAPGLSVWGSSSPPPPQSITKALDRIFSRLQITPPLHAYYASHSLRSGSVTACVLIGVPSAVIQARGYWTNDKILMNVYYDARLTYATSMHFFFGGLVPGWHRTVSPRAPPGPPTTSYNLLPSVARISCFGVLGFQLGGDNVPSVEKTMTEDSELREFASTLFLLKPAERSRPLTCLHGRSNCILSPL